MLLSRGRFLTVLLVACALGIVQCGKKSKSAQIQITTSPKNPVVFTAPITIGSPGSSTTTTINPPWFQFSVSINNPTDEPVTILALEVDIDTIDISGTTQTTTTIFSASSYTFTLNDVTCTYQDFGQFDPNGHPIDTTVTPVVLTGINNNQLFMVETGGGACPKYIIPTFYVSGPPADPNQTNFNYRVKVKPIGWFGTRAAATDRFDGFVNIYTR